jgi:hydrogenase maturation protease
MRTVEQLLDQVPALQALAPEHRQALAGCATNRVFQPVKLRIYEPPRFFEAFLRGGASPRFRTSPPDLRHLPGRLPNELDRSDGGRLRRRGRRPGARAAARMLYCGEWVESHVLHVFMLHAPDFLGYANAFEMARDHGEVVERALQLKKAGNALMRVIGGREIHPINVRVGGFYRAPTRAELAPVVEELKRAREFAIEAVSFTASLPCPDFEHVVVDAAQSGAAPGTVRRFDARSQPLPVRSLRSSTHAFGVPDAVELARSLDRLPGRLEVYAIEGTSFVAGDRMSPSVERAVAELAGELSASRRSTRR